MDKDELAAMASKPTEKYMFMIDSFDVLDEIKEQLAIKACEGKLLVLRVKISCVPIHDGQILSY